MTPSITPRGPEGRGPTDRDIATQKQDADWIRAAQGGDQDAFAALVAQYQGRAYWVAFGLLNDAEEARDVVQEAFLRVYRSLERFDFAQNFYTWLYRIVVNLSIDRLRRVSRVRSVALDDVAEPAAPSQQDASPGRSLEAGETSKDIRAVLDTLPPRYRTVMVLRELNGLSCKEIAGIVNSSHATVRWRLHMARKYFKTAWERRERQAQRKATEE